MKLNLALLVHFIHIKYCGSVHNIRSHFPYHTRHLDMCAKTSRAKNLRGLYIIFCVLEYC